MSLAVKWVFMFNKIFLPLILLALAFAAIAVQYQSNAPLHAILFNADGMYLPTLFDNLLAHGGSIRDWYLTPAPYFFPDYLLFLIAYWASKSAFHQFLVFSLLQLAAATAALAWIARTCVRSHATLAAVLAATLIGWLAVRPTAPFVFALASAYHFGAFLSALVFVALWLQNEQRPRPWQFPGMYILAFLAALSDPLFMVQAVAPFLVACALVRRQPRLFAFKAALPHIGVLVAAQLGVASYRWFITHSTRSLNKFGLAHFAQNAHELGSVVADLAIQLPLLGIIMAAYLLLGIACIVRVVPERAFLGLPRPLLLLLVFTLLAVASNVAAMLLMTSLVVTPRYLIAALTWPIVALTMLLAHWLGTRFAATGLAATAALVLLLGTRAVVLTGQAGNAPAGYPAQIACIDHALAAADAHRGIAGYWDAKRVQALSKRDLSIAQYMSDMTEHRWITSGSYFRSTYDFAIISAEGGPAFLLPAAQLIARNGPPVLTAICGDHTVLVYGNDQLRVAR